MLGRFIRIKEVQSAVGLSRSTIWRLEREGLFPQRKQIGPNAVAWLDKDIGEWQRQKIDLGTLPKSVAAKPAKRSR